MTRWLYATAAVLALSGCCNGGAGIYVRSPTWDGLGRLPTDRGRAAAKAPKPILHKTAATDGIVDKEAELTKLKAYSPEWWSVRDAIDSARDAKLAKTLIICSNCLPVPEDPIGSIAAQ